MRSISAIDVSNVNFEYILEQILLLSGILLLFMGATGLLMVLFPTITKDKVFLFEMYFIYSYMIILGAILVLYHKKILVKGHRT